VEIDWLLYSNLFHPLRWLVNLVPWAIEWRELICKKIIQIID
jgi:hypothetical protein